MRSVDEMEVENGEKDEGFKGSDAHGNGAVRPVKKPKIQFEKDGIANFDSGLLKNENYELGLPQNDNIDLSFLEKGYSLENDNSDEKDKKYALMGRNDIELGLIGRDTCGLGLIRREFAHHEKGVARVNNGSFGCCPATVLSAQEKWSRLFLQQPDNFYFNHLKNGILESRKTVAALVNAAHLDEIALIDNATTSVAVVLQHIAWSFTEGSFSKGDYVVMLKYSYGAVKAAIQAYAVRAGAHVVEVDLPFPVFSKEEIIQAFRSALVQRRDRPIRLVAIDHISSMPSIVLPLKELIRVCREENVNQVFVDGAHAIGNLDIDMQDIDADFYTSNLYKWFFCPPSVAFLYSKKSHVANLHHPVVSSEYGKGLDAEAAWLGNRDYSAQLSVPAAVEFVNQFEGGIEGIQRRNKDGALCMANMLAKAWNTHLGASPELCCSMVMVGLPDCLEISSEKDALDLRTRLRDEFGVEAPIYHRCTSSKEKVVFSAYTRISYQIYNTIDDYLKFRDAINHLVSKASQSKPAGLNASA